MGPILQTVSIIDWLLRRDPWFSDQPEQAIAFRVVAGIVQRHGRPGGSLYFFRSLTYAIARVGMLAR